jgi:hypothetical protein
VSGVRVFERQPDDSWDQIEIVAPADLATGYWHGTDVAISDDLLVSSSINDDHAQGDDAFPNSDVVQDFDVNIHDLLIVLQYYGTCG